MGEGGHSGRVTDVEVGFDRFEAAMILESCRAEGLQVEFLQMDRNLLGPGHVEPHRLLVLEADLEAVMQIINRSFPLTEHDVEAASPVPRRRPRPIGLRIGAVVIFIMILGPVSWAAVYVLWFLANLL